MPKIRFPQLEQSPEDAALSKAETILKQRQIAEILDELPDDDVEALTALYPQWRAGVALALNDLVRFQGVLYKVVQAHTTQADWTPPTVPALFTRFRNPETGPEPWVQPTGAQDAYAIGEQVTHDNPNDGGAIWVYESAIDANTTEPGRDGELDRYWTPVEAV